MIVAYTEIGFTVTKQGKCIICGKRAKRSKYFYQTQSPWNTKPPEDILAEESVKSEFWKIKPIKHAKCENEQNGILNKCLENTKKN